MLCNYPLCRYPGRFLPVIEIPTIRTLMGGGDELAKETRPTKLIGQPICRLHMDTYLLSDWIKPADWQALREAARENGYTLQEQHCVIITFEPVGYTPAHGYLEIER